MADLRVNKTFGQFPLSATIKKFSRYETIEGTFGKRYIVPVEGAKLVSGINPFMDFERFFKDFMGIVNVKDGNDYSKLLSEDMLNDSPVDNNIENAILNFVSKYGLLGLKKKAIRPLSTLVGKIPTEDEIQEQIFINNSFYPRKAKEDEKFLFTRQENLPSVEYGESVKSIFEFYKDMYRFIDNWSRHKDALKLLYKSNYDELNPPTLNNSSWMDYFRMFYAENINIGFDFEKDSLKLQLVNMELFEIIQLAVLLNFTDRRHRLKICRYCKNPYFETSYNTKYCDEYGGVLSAEKDQNSCYNKAKLSNRKIKDRLRKGITKDVILQEFQNEGSPYVTMDLINELVAQKSSK